MKKEITIGWIGAGFIGQTAHLINYADMSNVKIFGLAELRKDLGMKVAKKHNIENYFFDYRELLQHDNLDAIVAIVRQYQTFKLAHDVLKKGFNLFTEKPMAGTYNQAKELVDIAQKKKCNYVIGNMRLHDEGVQVAKKYFDKAIKKNNLGKLIYFRIKCFAGGDYCNIDGDIKTNEPAPNKRLAPMAPEWIPKNKRSEFEKFSNYFVHDISIVNHFFKDLPKISSVIYKKNSGSIILDYGKFFGKFDFGYLNQNKWDEEIEFYFTKGRINLILPPAFLRNQPAKVIIYNEKKGMMHLQPQANWTWSFKRQAISFIEHIISKKESFSSGKKSLYDLKLIEDIWKKIV